MSGLPCIASFLGTLSPCPCGRHILMVPYVIYITTYMVGIDLHGRGGLHHDLRPRLLQLGVVVELALEVDPTGGGVKLLK